MKKLLPYLKLKFSAVYSFYVILCSFLLPNVAHAQQVGAGGQAIQDFLKTGVQFLSVGVGAILVLMFAWAGFQYLSARDNANQVEAAKKHMFNVVLALLLYIFGFAILNWLIPGGITNIPGV